MHVLSYVKNSSPQKFLFTIKLKEYISVKSNYVSDVK